MYPDFNGEVAVVAVGLSSSQTVEVLNGQKERRGYPGVFAEGPYNMARSFGVRTQSTKFGISPDGVIQFKEGYGMASEAAWRARFQALVSN